MDSEQLIGIDEASKMLEVTPTTLRTWTKQGLIKAFRPSARGHRKYKVSDIRVLLGYAEKVEDATEMPNLTAVYCRVSSHEQKQKGDLDRQKVRVLEHCVSKGYSVGHVFDEVGSGMNDQRAKLLKVMDLARKGEISRVVVEHKDRLIRFNYNILLQFFNSHHVAVECVDIILSKSFENELVEDMLTLMASFSAKIYGKRSHKNRTAEKV
jgi:predicted site-specific integrase-resolvase